MPVLGRRCASVFRPFAPRFPAHHYHVFSSLRGGERTRLLCQLAPVLVGPPHHFNMPPQRRVGHGVLVPVAAILLTPLENL